MAAQKKRKATPAKKAKNVGKPRRNKIERALRAGAEKAREERGESKPAPRARTANRSTAKGGKQGPRTQRVSARRQIGLKVTPIADGKPAATGKVRLNRYLAMAGVCSRRAADEWIAGGRIEVNGERIRELGFQVDPLTDEVHVDGESVQKEKPVYVLLNKPTGVVCTNARHEQKPRVIDLLPSVRGRLFTVGRLDLDREGLLLVTNDGSFAQAMTHPRHGVPKVYAIKVRGKVSPDVLQKARGGIWLSDGPTSGMQIRIERGGGKDKTFLKVTLREGKNREIRRVFAKLGYPVVELKRVRIAQLSLHGLKPGAWRFLGPQEVQGLLAAASGEDEQDQGGLRR